MSATKDMNSRQRYLSALDCQPVDRPPVCVIDPTPGYRIAKDHRVYTITDPDAVEGAIRVFYGDAEGSVDFRVEEMLEDSRLPDEVMIAVAATQLQEAQNS